MSFAQQTAPIISLASVASLDYTYLGRRHVAALWQQGQRIPKDLHVTSEERSRFINAMLRLEVTLMEREKKKKRT